MDTFHFAFFEHNVVAAAVTAESDIDAVAVAVAVAAAVGAVVLIVGGLVV